MTGFRDPHAPWAAPQRMYDLYNTSDIATATNKVRQTTGGGYLWLATVRVQARPGGGGAVGGEVSLMALIYDSGGFRYCQTIH